MDFKNWRLLILGILAIIFWVSIWDITEILVNKTLKKYDKDNDDYRIIAFSTLGLISITIIYTMDAMKIFS